MEAIRQGVDKLRLNPGNITKREKIEQVVHAAKDAGIRLHLSEVKGPVMDRLMRSEFLQSLTGGVHLSQFAAERALSA